MGTGSKSEADGDDSLAIDCDQIENPVAIDIGAGRIADRDAGCGWNRAVEWDLLTPADRDEQQNVHHQHQWSGPK